MFLSEWREFPSAPCLAEKKNLMKAHVSMLLKSRASLTCFRTFFLPGRAEDLSSPRYLYLHLLYLYFLYLYLFRCGLLLCIITFQGHLGLTSSLNICQFDQIQQQHERVLLLPTTALWTSFSPGDTSVSTQYTVLCRLLLPYLFRICNLLLTYIAKDQHALALYTLYTRRVSNVIIIEDYISLDDMVFNE